MSWQAGHTVVRHRYARAGQRTRGTLWDAITYMQRRALGPDERPGDRALFAARAEGLSREAARALLLEHPGQRAAYHRLILSPGVPVADLRRWTRRTMADLSQHLGQDLHWVAVIHRNTGHPHVHLLLAGAGRRHIDDGRSPNVLLRRAEYALLRAAGDRHARDLAQDGRTRADAVHAELDLLAAGLAWALARELADEGTQSHKHLREEPEQRGAPGPGATRGR